MGEINVSDTADADVESRWIEFKEQVAADCETYKHEYLVHVEAIDFGMSDPQVAVDLLVPAEEHGLGELRQVGYRGWHLEPGATRSATIPVPDFSWSGGHLQEHPVMLRIYIDTRQDNKPPPFWSGKVSPGGRVKVIRESDGVYRVKVSYERKKMVTLTSQGAQHE